MKIKLDLNANDLLMLNNPNTEEEVISKAHEMLANIFDAKDNLIKCTIQMDDKDE